MKLFCIWKMEHFYICVFLIASVLCCINASRLLKSSVWSSNEDRRTAGFPSSDCSMIHSQNSDFRFLSLNFCFLSPVLSSSMVSASLSNIPLAVAKTVSHSLTLSHSHTVFGCEKKRSVV